MLFKDIPGQEQIKDYLLSTTKENRVGHAYLFSGEEGTGSLALAIAYAGYLNCKQPAENDACGSCQSCRKAGKLLHPDIHFVFPVFKTNSQRPALSSDKISEWREFVIENRIFNAEQWFANISDGKKSGMIYVEESREIIKKLSLRNFEGEYKVMIIWLPEKMNNSGANRLLKILEEPPGNTVFLLVSENAAALLPTILSRTQQLRIPFIEIDALATEISKKYKVSMDEARLAARLSQGNYVKAVDHIKRAGESSRFFELFGEMMRAAFTRKFNRLIEWTEKMAGMSRDQLKDFFDYSIAMLRESYIYNFKQAELIYLSSTDEEWVKNFSPYINDGNISKMVDELQLAHAHIEQNGNARIVLFDMLIKLTVGFNK